MHATTILGKIEWKVTPDGKLVFYTEEQAQPFEKISINDAEALREELDSHPRAVELFEANGITDPLEQIKQYAICRYGGREIFESKAYSCPLSGHCPNAKALCGSPGSEAFTVREMNIARLVSYELTDKQIAAHLFMSHDNVRAHIKKILRKIGCERRIGISNFYNNLKKS